MPSRITFCTARPRSRLCSSTTACSKAPCSSLSSTSSKFGVGGRSTSGLGLRQAGTSAFRMAVVDLPALVVTIISCTVSRFLARMASLRRSAAALLPPPVRGATGCAAAAETDV